MSAIQAYESVRGITKANIEYDADPRADLSLITSIYRTNQHLPQYTNQAFQVAQMLQQAGVSLELILVVNDASPEA